MLSQQELDNLLNGKNIDGRPLKPVSNKITGKFNLIVPNTTTQTLKKLKGFAFQLGWEKLDKHAVDKNELNISKKEVFKNYLSGGGIEVASIGTCLNFHLWQLYSGFDDKYIYIYRDTKFINKILINNDIITLLNEIIYENKHIGVEVETKSEPKASKPIEKPINKIKETESLLFKYINRFNKPLSTLDKYLGRFN